MRLQAPSTPPPAVDIDNIENVKKAIFEKSYPREDLEGILKQYNISIGNDPLALQNLERLRHSDSYCVITGQQLGLFGGPAYTILKGICALIWAKKFNAIPLFWLATEDHDIGEIQSATLLDSLGNLLRFRMEFVQKGISVEDLQIEDSQLSMVRQFCDTVKTPFQFSAGSYAKQMASFMAFLFRGTGLVFLEPYLLRPLSKDFFRAILEQERREPLLELFVKRGGYRKKLIKEPSGYSCDGQEVDPFTLLKTEPESFSPNVYARPLLQSFLLPTVAYVAGPSEQEYYSQLGDAHEALGVPFPEILLRFSMTFLSPVVQDLLSKMHLNPWDPLPDTLEELFPSVEQELGTLTQKWNEDLLPFFGGDLSKEALASTLRVATRSLKDKVIRARLQKLEIPSFGLHLLHNSLYPKNLPQERVFNWMSFQSQTEENLVQSLLNTIQEPTQGSLYAFL